MSKTLPSIGARRETLATEVRSQIEEMIVAGALEAGQKLNEVTLAGTMGVSRGTVREAIRSLADSGLIDLIANRGAYVNEISLAEIHNLYEVRGAIFAMACASAAQRVGDGLEADLIDRLTENLDTMRGVRDTDDRAAYYELNIEFHDMLLQAAANARAKAIYDNLIKEMHLYRRRGLSVANNIALSLDEHGAIFEAVKSGDPRRARDAAFAHIEKGFGRYMQIAEDGNAGDTADG